MFIEELDIHPHGLRSTAVLTTRFMLNLRAFSEVDSDDLTTMRPFNACSSLRFAARTMVEELGGPLTLGSEYQLDSVDDLHKNHQLL